MKNFLKEIFSRENLKKAMIYAAFTNTRLTTAEYIALNKSLREIEGNTNQETKIQMKKAS